VTDSKLVLGEAREQVAYKLMQDIFSVEGINTAVQGSTNRDHILKTYFECWQVVVGVKPKTEPKSK
jgi:hypothetical protein